VLSTTTRAGCQTDNGAKDVFVDRTVEWRRTEILWIRSRSATGTGSE